MLLLQHMLYDIAKTDLEAANILAKNNLYPQAIYFYSQACEKAAKSVVALYLISYEKKQEDDVSIRLKRVHGHKLLEITATIANIFVDYQTKSHLKRGGKESDEMIRTAKESIKKIQSRKPDMTSLIALYTLNVRGIYELFYRRLTEDIPPHGANPLWGILRELHKIPKTRYLKFNTLSQFLFIVLDGMDNYAQYPMRDTNYTNIGFLKDPEIKEACSLLDIMVTDMVNLVPLMWKKIESLT
jgi:hypothetical protein